MNHLATNRCNQVNLSAMPVPVSVSHPSGAGLASALMHSVESAGPWARAKETQPEQTSAMNTDKGTGTALPAPSVSAPAAASAGTEPLLVVDQLEFAYPGLGGLCMQHAICLHALQRTAATQTLHAPPVDGRPVPGLPSLIKNLSFSLQPGSRCLLLGANGAGKTTFLKVGLGHQAVLAGVGC